MGYCFASSAVETLHSIMTTNFKSDVLFECACS